MSVGRQSEGQLPCGDVRCPGLRDVAGDRSFKHVYICFRRRLSPVAKASAKELTASYSARGSIPAESAVELRTIQSELRPFGNSRDLGVGVYVPNPHRRLLRGVPAVSPHDTVRG